MAKPTLSASRVRYLAIAMTISTVSTLYGQDSGASEREAGRRGASVQEGQILLEKGDEAYLAARYGEAVAAYAGALDSFPKSPMMGELRAAAAQRYGQAAIEHGRALVRKGDVPGAKAVLDQVLAENVAPGHIEAKAYRMQLDDPIRTNPALTAEHAGDVDAVRRALYLAGGAFDLGKFDEARRHYEKVLRIDAYNKAARRGMERVNAAKSDYYRAASDQFRAMALAEVAGEWELPLTADLVLPELQGVQRLDGVQGDFVPIANKLSRIVIPSYRLEQGNLLEAIDFARLRASENDNVTLDPANKGINIAINLGSPDGAASREILAKTIDLQVTNVPLDTLLKYITDLTGTRYKADDFAVTIVPAGDYGNELVARTYRVPPDFMSNLSSGAAATDQQEDIFNTAAGTGGVLAERVGAREALAQQGVAFPEGASASFNGATNTLRIVNTPGNQDIIEQIIESIARTEPVSVAVRVTMLKVEQSRLEELGFDWLLDTFQFGGDSWIPGASKLNLSGGTVGNGTPITDAPLIPGSFTSLGPVTAGNRSGDAAVPANTIDSIIAVGSSRGRQTNSRAPGVFGVNGILDGTSVQTLVRGLDQKKGVDLMAQPSVTTRSGQAASIRIVREFLYPTEYEPPEVPNTITGTVVITTDGDSVTDIQDLGSNTIPVTPATPTAFVTKEVGITLDVLPVADANRRFVNITLNPVVTDFDGFVNYGSPINSSTNAGILGNETLTITDNAILMPVFSVNRANTNMEVADGATIVIGGLLKDEIIDVEDKTPILGDLPVIGRLFQSDVKNHRSTALVFLVSVELLDPTGRPYRDR